MNRKTFGIICLIFCMYISYTQYLIYEYGEMNTKLQRSIDTLLASCTNNKLMPNESLPYK